MRQYFRFLAAFFEQHTERFRVPPRVSFQQVYLNPDKHAAPDKVATALLAELRDGASPESMGDSFMLGYAFDSVSRYEIARQFGKGFAEQVVALELGEWRGPIDSGVGLHPARVHTKAPGRLPPLDEVRTRVATEWLAERRQERKEAAYRRLRERYEVVVKRDAPDPIGPGAKVTSR